MIVGALLASAANAWDAAECASSTQRLGVASHGAETASKGLAVSPSSATLTEVRSALIEASEQLARAQVACGVREKTPPAKDRHAASEKALKDIDAWTARMQKTDPRYKGIEDVLLRHLDYVLKGMPAEYWLPTLQLMYGAAADAGKASARPSTLERF